MKRVGLVISGIVLLIGIGAFIYISHQNTPLTASERQAAFQKTLGRTERVVKNVPTGVKSYHGTYDSFSYPARFSPYSYKDKNTNPQLIDSMLLYDRDTRQFFSSQVRTFQGTFAGVPDVTLRRNQQDVYTESQAVIGGESAVVFTKTDPDYEKSAFIIRGDRLYTFSVTGPQEAEEIFTAVTSSVKLF